MFKPARPQKFIKLKGYKVLMACGLWLMALVLTFNFLFLTFHISQAQAATARGSLEVIPAFTEVLLEKPEQAKTIVFSYKNYSSKPIDLEIFPIDFKQADGTGAINFLGTEPGSFSYSLSSFLSLESNTIQIDPGEKKDFSVKVKNREDLSPGGHYAAIVARLKVPEHSDIGQATVAPSLSALILLRKVGGERFNMSLSSLDFPSSQIVFGYPTILTALFKNEGNVHVSPFGTVEVKDVFGRMIYKGIINTSSLRVFPETRRYIKIDMDKTAWSLPISLNSITAKGQDSLGKVNFNYTDSFLYVNPPFIIVLILGGIALTILKKRKENRVEGKKKK